MLTIRVAEDRDFEAIWTIFHQVVSGGDAYAFSPDTSIEEAYQLWMKLPRVTYVATLNEQVVGTYYLKPNQPGLGSHVCNAGFMVLSTARGKGIGRRLGEHALQQAKLQGFKAMQFNFVVSTNQPAVKLWKSLDFTIVGTLPKAFHHQKLGLVDVYVMYQWLD
ncbi:MAG: GNAT family N-acetyltransferase [Microcoleaceae cyanobacterium]